jgi:hypothetical protein
MIYCKHKGQKIVFRTMGEAKDFSILHNCPYYFIGEPLKPLNGNEKQTNEGNQTGQEGQLR